MFGCVLVCLFGCAVVVVCLFVLACLSVCPSVCLSVYQFVFDCLIAGGLGCLFVRVLVGCWFCLLCVLRAVCSVLVVGSCLACAVCWV